MIIPFNALGIWFEAIPWQKGYRIAMNNNGKKILIDSGEYTKEQATQKVEHENAAVFMKGVRDE